MFSLINHKHEEVLLSIEGCICCNVLRCLTKTWAQYFSMFISNNTFFVQTKILHCAAGQLMISCCFNLFGMVKNHYIKGSKNISNSEIILVEVKFGVTESEYSIYSLMCRYLRLKLGVVVVSKERDKEKN